MKKIVVKDFIEKGKYRTKALFKEYAPYYGGIDSYTVYTLSKEDDTNGGFHSLYQLYMKEGDPTEYRFIEKYFVDPKHWEQLCRCTWFKPYIEEWRKELALRIESELLDILVSDARNNEKTGATSAKYLLDKYYTANNKTPKKTKHEENKEKLSKEVSRVLLEDAERIGIKLQWRESEITPTWPMKKQRMYTPNGLSLVK